MAEVHRFPPIGGELLQGIPRNALVPNPRRQSQVQRLQKGETVQVYAGAHQLGEYQIAFDCQLIAETGYQRTSQCHDQEEPPGSAGENQNGQPDR